MAYDCFLLIHSCIASTFLFGIYQYAIRSKKPFKYLLVPLLAFWITWVIAATSLSCPCSVLEDFTKAFTIAGVFLSFIGLIAFVVGEGARH